MKKPKNEFGRECKVFMAETGMTAAELARAAGVKETTLVAAMVGRTPGHDLIPAVRSYITTYRGAAV